MPAKWLWVVVWLALKVNKITEGSGNSASLVHQYLVSCSQILRYHGSHTPPLSLIHQILPARCLTWRPVTVPLLHIFLMRNGNLTVVLACRQSPLCRSGWLKVNLSIWHNVGCISPSLWLTFINLRLVINQVHLGWLTTYFGAIQPTIVLGRNCWI